MIIILSKLYRSGKALAGAARRRISSDKQVPTVVHQKPGPLQTIFLLPPDEVDSNLRLCASIIYVVY
jgi:hypothetical protein